MDSFITHLTSPLVVWANTPATYTSTESINSIPHLLSVTWCNVQVTTTEMHPQQEDKKKTRGGIPSLQSMPASLFCLTDRRHLPYIPPSVCIPVAVVVIIITFGGDAIKYLRETKTQLLHHRLIIMCTYILGAINAAVICKYQRQLSWPANFHSAIRNQTSYVAVHLHHLQQKRQRVRPLHFSAGHAEGYWGLDCMQHGNWGMQWRNGEWEVHS